MGRGLYEKFHGTPLDRSGRNDARVSMPVPRAVTGMGPLLILEVERPGGRVEQWHFQRPYPRLCFEALTPTARGRSQMWILGGGYTVARGRFESRAGTAHRMVGLEQASRALPAIVSRYRQTHGGRNPTEAIRSRVSVPSELVPLGRLHAVVYDADKGDGVYPYRHPFAERAAPLVCSESTGSQLYLVGGAYTVTPHGIEDSDE